MYMDGGNTEVGQGFLGRVEKWLGMSEAAQRAKYEKIAEDAGKLWTDKVNRGENPDMAKEYPDSVVVEEWAKEALTRGFEKIGTPLSFAAAACTLSGGAETLGVAMGVGAVVMGLDALRREIMRPAVDKAAGEFSVNVRDHFQSSPYKGK